MRSVPPRIVLCNGADLPANWAGSTPLVLEYRKSYEGRNINLGLPNFVRDVYYLLPRFRDLLEIAAFIFGADRLVSRGPKNSVEYHSWSRQFFFAIRVRDYEFWNRPTVKEKLSEALTFMSGDRAYQFSFQPGHQTPPADMFDKEAFQIRPQEEVKVILFSGGLDSLTGTLECLENSSDQLCLISHQSGQPGTAKTQNNLIRYLQNHYPNRIKHFKLRSGLHGIRAKEETQRTRAFLFTSVAYALSHVYAQPGIFVYENGITSINFLKRQDQINARVSRTTHPKTMHLLEDFYSQFADSRITISTPYLWKTKTDIFRILGECGGNDLVTSAVSCSRTFEKAGDATHCGGCSQCVDRRFAAYGSSSDDIDDGGIYTEDFILRGVKDLGTKTRLIDYVRQARDFASFSLEDFSHQMFSELTNLIDYVSGESETDKVEKVWKLCRHHGNQVCYAIRRMREVHDDPYLPLPGNSFLQMIAEREYLMYSYMQQRGIRIFYAYSHRDEEFRKQLENHLSILKRQDLIEGWHDRKISAGREWEGEIDENLNTAHIILLLISSDFIASDYCYEVEMQRAMERHDAGEARIIPILLRSVDWDEAPFGKLQALPKDMTPVTKWDDQDEAFTDIAKGIRKVVGELSAKQY